MRLNNDTTQARSMGGGMRRISRGGREGPPWPRWAAGAVTGAALLVLWMAVATTFGSCAMPGAMSGMKEARVAPPQGGAGGDSGSEERMVSARAASATRFVIASPH